MTHKLQERETGNLPVSLTCPPSYIILHNTEQNTGTFNDNVPLTSCRGYPMNSQVLLVNTFYINIQVTRYVLESFGLSDWQYVVCVSKANKH